MSVPDDAIDPDGGVVRAAGAVLWRPRRDRVEVALVHRPRYDDWSFPKGKQTPGEDDVATALREVREETGYDAEVGPSLGETRYVNRGRPKVVRYWAMRALGGAFVPSDEVDRLEWVDAAETHQWLTYGRDREVLGRFIDCDVTSFPR